MKQLIVPIAIIVALIAFFVIIDRKEFSRHDDVETVQIKSPTTNRKPTVSVPEMKPANELKPAGETKPMDEMKPVVKTKPVTEAKPVTETQPKIEAKPAGTKLIAEAKSATEVSPITEAKPAEANPVAETKPAAETKSKAKPSAVPVATAEEAIRANEDALKLFLEQFPKEKTITPTKDIKLVTETVIENKPVPMAVPVLTPEEAIKANKEAIRFQRNKAIAEAFQLFVHKIGLNSNRIHFILSLLPLLFVFDVLLFKRKKKSNSKILDYISLPRRVRILFSVSLLAFGILVFVPWSVYFGNSLQFPFIFQDFVNWNLRVLTISIVGVSIILLLIPPIVSDYLVAFIAGLGLCVYVQAMFMNQYLGTMDGNEPEWSKHQFFGVLNAIIWIVIILFPFILKKIAPSYFSKVISMATGIILFLELLATASMVVSASPRVWVRYDSYYVDGSKQFQLSKEKNIILFIMDSLGSENVKECFRVAPETKETVKDFIWYADACSYYSATYLGLSHELTGTSFPPPANSNYEMFEKMWHSTSTESFYKQIHDFGYDARFYVAQGDYVIGAADCYHEYFSNIAAVDVIYVIDYKSLHNCLKQMSSFSSVPYLFKQYFYYSFDLSDNVVQKHVPSIPSRFQSCPYGNDAFLKKMITSGISTDADTPILAYYYTVGAHVPWYYDEKCNRVEKPFDSPIPNIKGCFYLLSELIRLLKESGVYDNTAILLCADHGGHRGFSTPFDMIFMVKPFQESKTEVSIDDSKVQSIDILPTLLKLACGDTADFKVFDGYPSFDIPNERIRKVYTIESHKDYPVFKDEQIKGNCVVEYIFNDIKTLKFGDKTESFVQRIPFTNISQENK